MDYLKLFFSFFGRIGRTVYWSGLGFNIMTVPTVFFVADFIVRASGGGPDAKVLEKWLLIIVAMASLVSVLSLHVRRMHDRGLSGWWGACGIGIIALCGWWISRFLLVILKKPADGLLLVSPALAVLALTFFQFGFVRGARGSNTFGPAPRDEEVKAGISAVPES